MNVRLLIFFICTISLAECVAPSEKKVSEDKSSSSPDFEALADDGIWCWFSDPRAIYHRGEKEKLYFGFINGKGDVVIASKDLNTDEIESFVLHDTLEIDDHNVPSILILPNGKLLAFYNEHNGDVFMRKSLHAENIGAWEEEQIVSKATDEYRYTYTNPVRLSDEKGRIYLIGRKVGPSRSFEHWLQYFKYSDDDGQSWSEEFILLDNEGRKNPPYLKVATDRKSRIDFLFTDGHPKIGSDVSVYHMYYQSNAFYQTNGRLIAHIDQIPVTIQSVDKVYDATQSNIRSWIWDIALKDGSPVITYARFPSEQDHIYHYAYWQDDRWIDYEIVNSGGWITSLRQGDRVREAHYSGGVVLDHQYPAQVYLSRNIFGKFEIERRHLLPDGRWSSSLITENSSMDNVRPYVADQSPPGRSLLLWASGVYRHYTEYDMEIKFFSDHH